MVKDYALKRPEIGITYKQHYGNYTDTTVLAQSGRHGFSEEEDTNVAEGVQELDTNPLYSVSDYEPVTVVLPMPNPLISSYATPDDSAEQT